jgi:hypothetical protein
LVKASCSRFRDVEGKSEEFLTRVCKRKQEQLKDTDKIEASVS